MEKLDVSVIVPINSAKQIDFDDYFDRCIKSILIQTTPINELLIVHTGEDLLQSKIENYDSNSPFIRA